MRRPKTLQFAIDFAVCCERYGFSPTDLADLIQLSHRAKRAMERECSEPNAPDSARATDAVGEKAAFMGLFVRWFGLWPSFSDLHDLHGAGHGGEVRIPFLP